MSMLDQHLLFNIKRDFKLWEDRALNKEDFVTIMLHHLGSEKNKLSLVGSLIELFDQVDVNHDMKLEWDEFSNHIIELGMLREERTFIDDIKNYEPALGWRDEGKHENYIEHIFYLPILRHLLVMERDNRNFKVYNMRSGKLYKTVSGHRGPVISAAHAPEHSYVATSGNDLTIHLWDDNNYQLR